MTMKTQPKLVSDSLEENTAQAAMQNEINELRQQLSELSIGLEYLATANMELSRDMQLIYESLKDISTIANGEDLYRLFGQWGKYSDDDLPN